MELKQQFTFDYHAGSIRREFLTESPKAHLMKNSAANKNNKGLVAALMSLFARK